MPGDQFHNAMEPGLDGNLKQSFALSILYDRNIQRLASSDPPLYFVQPPGAAQPDQFFSGIRCRSLRRCGHIRQCLKLAEILRSVKDKRCPASEGSRATLLLCHNLSRELGADEENIGARGS